MLTARFWAFSLLFALGTALLLGIPTVLIPNPFFSRMTPTGTQDYIIWAVSVILMGPLLALSVLYPAASTAKHSHTGNGRAFASTILSFFSIGCPICNKLVVFLLGIGGAMTFFNPLRPFLGMASILLLAVTLVLRLRVLRSGCPVPIDAKTSLFKQ